MERMQRHAERFDTEIVYDHIHTAKLQQRPFELIGDSGTYTCDALIIATGASAQYLGLPSEETFAGKGFRLARPATASSIAIRWSPWSVAATASRKRVPVNIARSALIHRRDKLRSEKILQDKLFEKPPMAISACTGTSIWTKCWAMPVA
jgi:thioredoxin reductase (NADPH)